MNPDPNDGPGLDLLRALDAITFDIDSGERDPRRMAKPATRQKRILRNLRNLRELLRDDDDLAAMADYLGG